MNSWKLAGLRRLSHTAFLIGLSAGLAACGTVAQTGRASAAGQASRSARGLPMETALRLARASRENGDLASAINLYRSVVAIQATDRVVIELADTLADAGSTEEAIEFYSSVDPKSGPGPGALLGLQRAYMALGEPDSALQVVDEAAALALGDHRILIARGVALDLLGRHEEAQSSYRRVLESKPRNVAARSNLALSLAMIRRFDEAIRILEPMSESSGATPRVRQNLALIYGLAGDTASAGNLSRADLDADATAANLRFFEYARGERE